MCLSLCMCVICVQEPKIGQKRSSGVPWDCEWRCGCWEANLNHLQKQQLLFTDELLPDLVLIVFEPCMVNILRCCPCFLGAKAVRLTAILIALGQNTQGATLGPTQR